MPVIITTGTIMKTPSGKWKASYNAQILSGSAITRIDAVAYADLRAAAWEKAVGKLEKELASLIGE